MASTTRASGRWKRLPARLWARMLPCLLLCAPLIPTGVSQETVPAINQTDAPEKLFADASAAFQKGAYYPAIAGFQAAADGFAKAKDSARQISALGNLCIALQAVGQYRFAFSTMWEAERIARQVNDAVLIGQLQAIKGSLSTFSRSARESERLLRASIAEARASGDRVALATLLHEYALVGASNASADEPDGPDEHRAVAAFAEVLALCAGGDQPELVAKTHANQAMMQLNLAVGHLDHMQVQGPQSYFHKIDQSGYEGHLQKCLDLLAAGETALATVESPYTRSLLATTLGDCYRTMVEKALANQETSAAKALALYQIAIQSAKESGNPLALSHALGALGRLYERGGRYPEALDLSREAWRLAQESSQPDLVFEWSWQCGRILNAAGNPVDARKAYDVAWETLSPIRNDIAIAFGNRNVGQTFRQAVGAFYFERAGLILGPAAAGEPTQDVLKTTRDVVEALKSAELEDYFQDECINIARSKVKDVDVAIDEGAAVLYTIPLSTGTALLVTIGGKIHFARSTVTGPELERDATRLRLAATQPKTFIDFKEPATRLYDAIIRPVRPLLDANGITTLIFVPDGALRTIPMAALHDGKRFLIESHALAISPGLDLMDPEERTPGSSGVFLAGLTQARRGHSALPWVQAEVDRISARATSPQVLIDQSFLKRDFQNAITANPFKIIHIASHGKFQRDSGDSYFLTYDGELSLNELEALIRPKAYDENPVEMLCLSACQTAVGDERAALGLAGIAVKSGARSALASLWNVDDQTTSELMDAFYGEMLQGASRAQALRAAQISVLRRAETRHPYFWAPFMIIGNWK